MLEQPEFLHPLATRFAQVRRRSMALAAPLSDEDCLAQSMPDASPVKWHLAHTTWFFETFILEPWEAHFAPFHPAFRVLYNSYYNGVGEKHPRPQRGLLTRPSRAEVVAYRQNVDARMLALLGRKRSPELAALVELGLQHEQQHQELIVTDVTHLLSLNPLFPAYQPDATVPVLDNPLAWHDLPAVSCRWAMRGGILLRQRAAAAPAVSGALSARFAAGDERGIPRLHRRWRL